jgi:hypothetical protein
MTALSPIRGTHATRQQIVRHRSAHGTSRRCAIVDFQTIAAISRARGGAIDPKQSSACSERYPARRLATKPKQFKVPLEGPGGRKANRLHADGSSANHILLAVVDKHRSLQVDNGDSVSRPKG